MEHLGQNPWGPGVVIKHPMIPAIYHPTTSPPKTAADWTLDFWKPISPGHIFQDFYKRGPSHIDLKQSKLDPICLICLDLVSVTSWVVSCHFFFYIFFKSKYLQAEWCATSSLLCLIHQPVPLKTSSPNFFSANLRNTEVVSNPIGVANQSNWVDALQNKPVR